MAFDLPDNNPQNNAHGPGGAGAALSGKAAPENGDGWAKLGRHAYEGGRSWRETNRDRQWDDNYRAFHSAHPSGSKFLSEAYKHRSTLFRPKTRSILRQQDAAVAAAFFATRDVVSVQAGHSGEPAQRASAAVNQELLNYRLDGHPINWFLTLLGAWQDTRVTGICAAHAYWRYEAREVEVEVERPVLSPIDGEPMIDPATGEPLSETMVGTETEVLADEPVVELIAPENFIIDPGAVWTDPVNTSPYIVHRIPMHVVDVKARMAAVDDKTGEPEWHVLDDETIARARGDDADGGTRQSREQYRGDPKDSGDRQIDDHDIVWVHKIVMRVEGRDQVWYQLHNGPLLSDPKPIEAVYPHCRTGNRPYVMGCSVLEAHRPYPSSLVELIRPLQREVNDTVNQRMDVVRYAMNPRVYYGRGAGVDMQALNRSRPGGPVQVHDIGQLHIDRPPDVGRSSYEEEDRLKVESDELAGHFSGSSIQSNRRLNETVGGMEMLSQSAASLGDFDIRVFGETFVKPLLQQLVHLEQAYESDEKVLAIAGDKARLYARYGVSDITDEILEGEATVRINVGVGATNPAQKLQRFQIAAKTVSELFPEPSFLALKFEEVVKEVFGAVGYDAPDRFFEMGEDPDHQHLVKMIKKLKEKAEGEEMKARTDLRKAQLQSETTLEKTRLDNQAELRRRIMELMEDEEADNRALGHELHRRMIEHRMQTQREDREAARQATRMPGGMPR